VVDCTSHEETQGRQAWVVSVGGIAGSTAYQSFVLNEKGMSKRWVAEGTERLKTLLEVATGIYSEIGESKEVLFNTRAYACLRCLKNKA
jgi:hypothetical protein